MPPRTTKEPAKPDTPRSVGANAPAADNRPSLDTPTSELESCVLALVARLGPCTAYVVRNHFGASPSSFWRGSRGAVYPSIRRLQVRGWIEARLEPWGRHGRRVYRITRPGVRRLRRWIGPPFPEGVGASTQDPIRTRIYFIDRLPPDERIRFAEEAHRRTLEQLDLIRKREDVDAGRDPGGPALARLGAIRELEARADWLRDVVNRLGGTLG